ncbi:TfoX/Sxy family protein [Streptomyces sp. MNU76]|uniref:TfoX/Sxy family protein n=1 Tax=Streptomyces sp. MNU76 TaxID=2560026 RepID=UPI001E4FC8A6|nr:TfoX/Sxy family protein [Streptomyces sp. MNU76]MCC9711526.1 TfoX/Sxy family protein [Streptomyces sp. MNU76]
MERIRRRLGTDQDVPDRRLFGGIAFLQRGTVAVGVGVRGDDRMVRVGPDCTDATPARPVRRTS